ncbi:unnamed protein product [Anisakis simplex]|uniref:DB domain-containing protein n=1 Tax=Anisakis simplex TaxID=6269 RepID=A0A0M3JD41_ANISI|nr:unnamed protein product [Anisakis simplex]
MQLIHSITFTRSDISIFHQMPTKSIYPAYCHVFHSYFQSPNEAFLSCCMDRQLPDACLQKCNFHSYTKQALTAMFFKQDTCPLEAMREMQYCAAQGRDHRECCIRNGVTNTIAGDKCLVFCDQRPGIVTQLDITYLACFDRFENMKTCFWDDIERTQRRK